MDNDGPGFMEAVEAVDIVVVVTLAVDSVVSAARVFEIGKGEGASSSAVVVWPRLDAMVIERVRPSRDAEASSASYDASQAICGAMFKIGQFSPSRVVGTASHCSPDPAAPPLNDSFAPPKSRAARITGLCVSSVSDGGVTGNKPANNRAGSVTMDALVERTSTSRK